MLNILKKTIRTGCVTEPYPGNNELAPEGFRGRIEISADQCTHCGECVSACPGGVIRLNEEKKLRTLTLSYCGCIFCGRCEEVCRYGAIRLTREFEMASKVKDDLLVLVRRKYDGRG